MADGFRGRARVHGHHPGIRVRGKFAEDRVGEALFLPDVLEQARGHAAAKKIVEDRDAEAVCVAEGNRRDADAEMHLFEVALGFQVDGRAGLWRTIGFGGTCGLHMAKFALH